MYWAVLTYEFGLKCVVAKSRGHAADIATHNGGTPCWGMRIAARDWAACRELAKLGWNGSEDALRAALAALG